MYPMYNVSIITVIYFAEDRKQLCSDIEKLIEDGQELVSMKIHATFGSYFMISILYLIFFFCRWNKWN